MSGDVHNLDNFQPAALREKRRAKVYGAYEAAAADPFFMAVMRETTKAFDVALQDGLTEPDSR